MKHKDEAFDLFKNFKALVENQTRNKINIFGYGRDGEYISNESIYLCKKEGIKKEIIAPYNLEKSGVAERKNEYNVEVSYAMLHEQNLMKFLCGEATNAVVYVQNRVPHQEFDNETPEEVFIGVKIDVEQVCIFGCPVYFHVAKDERNKHKAMGRKCTFFGYFEDYKSFRIHIPSQR